MLRRQKPVPLLQPTGRKFLTYTRPKLDPKPAGKFNWATYAAIMSGTAFALTLLDKDKRQQWQASIQDFHQSIFAAQPIATDIVAIPQLPQTPGIVHGVSTRELGNFGFVTLKDGVTSEQLTADIAHGVERIGQYHRAPHKKPLLIVNETAYATKKAPNLQRNADGTPAFIVTLTQDNIGSFIANNKFAADGQFASLREKCVSVTTDGFVSNVSSFGEYQLYFAVNTADAASVVLFDAKSGVIGIMACSWHNVAKAEFSDLIKRMCDLGAYPAAIQVGVGPGLGPESFEFSKSDARYFYEPGLMDKRDNKPFHGKAILKKHIKDHPTDAQKCLLDLPGMLRTLATDAGIPDNNIHLSHWDSLLDARFFSARRNTPADERAGEAQRYYPKTARGITFIGQNKPKPDTGGPLASLQKPGLRRMY